VVAENERHVGGCCHNLVTAVGEELLQPRGAETHSVESNAPGSVDRVGHESGPDAPEKIAELRLRHAEMVRNGVERNLAYSGSENADEVLFRCANIRQNHNGSVGTKLHTRRGTPEHRVGRVKFEHVAMVAHSLLFAGELSTQALRRWVVKVFAVEQIF
jgi:hypothetical protein